MGAYLFPFKRSVSVLVAILIACYSIFGEETTERIEVNERTHDVYDLLLETPLPYLSDCTEEGCHVGIRGTFQTLLIPVTENGEMIDSPLLIEKPVGMDKMYEIDLPFTDGFHVIQIGDDRYGVWVLDNMEVVFAKEKSRRADASTTSSIGSRSFGGPSEGTGGTPDPTVDRHCGTYDVIIFQRCTRLNNGSVHLIQVVETRNCNNQPVDVSTYEMTISPPLSDLITYSNL